MKNLWKIGIAIAILVVGATVYWELTPDYEENTTVDITTDLTIDSLRNVIEYYETLEPAKADTVRDTLIVKEYVSLNDSTKRYTTNYSDSTITATITSTVVGVMTSQEFEYFMRRRLVREVTNTITRYEVTTIDRTTTRTLKPRPYFFVGGEAGTESLGPIIGFTNAKQYSVFYRYDVITESHNVGITIPIKFNLNPFR